MKKITLILLLLSLFSGTINAQNYQDQFTYHHISDWQEGMKFYVADNATPYIYQLKGKKKLLKVGISDFIGKIFKFKRHEQKLVDCGGGEQCSRLSSIFEYDKKEYLFKAHTADINDKQTKHVVEGLVYYADIELANKLFVNKNFHVINNVEELIVTVNEILIISWDSIKFLTVSKKTSKKDRREKKIFSYSLSGTNTKGGCIENKTFICNFDNILEDELVYETKKAEEFKKFEAQVLNKSFVIIDFKIDWVEHRDETTRDMKDKKITITKIAENPSYGEYEWYRKSNTFYIDFVVEETGVIFKNIGSLKFEDQMFKAYGERYVAPFDKYFMPVDEYEAMKEQERLEKERLAKEKEEEEARLKKERELEEARLKKERELEEARLKKEREIEEKKKEEEDRRQEAIEWAKIRSECGLISEVDPFEGTKKSKTPLINIHRPNRGVQYEEIGLLLGVLDGRLYLVVQSDMDLGCANPHSSDQSYVQIKLKNGTVVKIKHVGDIDCGDFKLIGSVSQSEVNKLKQSPIDIMRLSGTEYNHDIKDIKYKEFFIDKLKCLGK